MNSKFYFLLVVALTFGFACAEDEPPKFVPGIIMPPEIKRKLPGGFRDSNNPETYEEVTKLLSNGVCDKTECFYLVKIYHVSKQIVAGVKYSVLGMFRDKAAQYYTMRVEIYHVVWENKTERKFFQ